MDVRNFEHHDVLAMELLIPVSINYQINKTENYVILFYRIKIQSQNHTLKRLLPLGDNAYRTPKY